MSKKRVINLILMTFILTVSMGVNECSQQTNMNMRSLRNFFGAPFMALGDWVEGTNQSALINEYNELRRPQTIAEPDLSPNFFASFCRSSSLNNASPAQIEELTTWLIDSYCACSPWQEASACTPNPTCCSSTNCPPSVRCVKICPNDLTIFQRNKRSAPPVDGSGNYFAFVNTAFDQFVNEVRPLPRGDLTASVPNPAYNLGMIAARRKFNELAFFNQGTEPSFANPQERVRYYREAIDKIFDNQPTDFPGFASLSALSSDPMVQEYLMQKISEEWLDRAMYRSLSEMKVNPSNSMNAARTSALTSAAMEGIEELGSVTITFGYADAGHTGEQSAQALEGYHVYTQNGDRMICVVDPNYPIGSETQVGGAAVGGSMHRAFSEPPPECYPVIRVSSTGATYTTKRREHHNPPISVIDEDGIPVLHSYTDHEVTRPLYDASVQYQADRRDAVLERPLLRSRCLRQSGCRQ